MVQNREILNLAPSYQRRKRWDETKRSHLIESLLMNIPIPPVFLYEQDLARYEVMDGQQRLNAIRGFFDNEFALRGLVKWPELNGRTYAQLPSRIQAGLNRRGLAAVIILTESGESPQSALEIRQYVFERLNTGGEKLNAQEVRNCIYASPFNDMLIAIARTPEFTSAWSIPPKEPDEPHKVSESLMKNRLYSTMADCEIVLRFFTLREFSRFKGGMKKALSDCMISMKSLSKNECDSFAKEYTDVLKCSISVFGGTLFRLPNRRGQLSGRHSVPLSDAVLLSVDRLSLSKRKKLIASSQKAVSHMRKRLEDETDYKTLVGRANTRASILERIDLVSKMFDNILQGA
ncbi:MAG: hypothetical protein A2Z25_16775 [Planctomycetes bacterium RBG_16_55_9]|nr:MAG: hypothetical protein A2Z25_16775 [Planctomycetes bacterium RBG_16_55_9]